MKCQRQVLHIHWSQHLTNAEISARTGLSPVMDFIRRRRLSVFGHIARLTHSSTQCPTSPSWPSIRSFTWQGLETSPGRPRPFSHSDQLRNDTGSVPAKLWRQAILRGHGGSTRRPQLATRWWRRRGHEIVSYLRNRNISTGIDVVCITATADVCVELLHVKLLCHNVTFTAIAIRAHEAIAYKKHTNAHGILTAIFPSKPRLASCPTDSQSPVIIVLGTNYSVPRTRTKFGDRAFSAAGPVVWNSLQTTVHHTDSLHSFKSRLKSHFLPRDASAEHGDATVSCPSVRL